MVKIHQADGCVMVDHTPVGAVAMGDVVIVDSYPLVCHKAIAAGRLGALSIHGGVYLCTVKAGVTVAAGDKIYWETATSVITKTATDKPFGVAIQAAAAGTITPIFHDPAWARL
jgi:predicted RecA/RadA family phage recombinase